MRLLISAVCALTFCLLTTGAWADSVPVQNASFDTVNAQGLNQPCIGSTACFNAGPIPGWSSPTGGWGSFEPTSAYFSPALPAGDIVAYTNGGGTLSQTLGVSLLPNSIYTLSVDVGRRLDVTAASYTISLTDGPVTNAFCTTSGSNGSIAAGTFTDVTLTCATGASAPAGVLGISFSGGGRQIDLDNVSLNVTSAVSTPEPGAIALTFVGLFMGGLLFVRTRRNQNLQSASS